MRTLQTKYHRVRACSGEQILCNFKRWEWERFSVCFVCVSASENNLALGEWKGGWGSGWTRREGLGNRRQNLQDQTRRTSTSQVKCRKPCCSFSCGIVLMYKNIQNEKFILWNSRAYEPHSPAAKYIYELNQLNLGREFYHPEILAGRPRKRKKKCGNCFSYICRFHRWIC